MTAGGGDRCPLCGYGAQVYLFTRHHARIVRCENCGLVHLAPRPDTGAPDRREPEPSGGGRLPLSSSTEYRAAEAYAAALSARHEGGSRLLAVVADGDPFLAAAPARGLAIASRIDMRDVERGALPSGPFDAAAVLFQLERACDPVTALSRIRETLVPDGTLLLVVASLDSWPARVLRGQWPEWHPEHRSYFDLQTIQSACLLGGFAELEWTADRRHYTLDHVSGRAAAVAPTLLTRLVYRAAPLVPRPWRTSVTVRFPGSGLVLTARRAEPPPRPLLSVVMPVFNERATFERTFLAVLGKQCDGVDKEVVVVESRSTDGTRELVQKYETTPGVTVVYEDRPRGKGAAVRTGLSHAKGTIVLIQDADDEYDVDDYDALLEPILNHRRAFVLGSRHIGSWKMRTFANQPAVSAFFNAGHILFRTALNVIYRQRIKDPFTMYKVFRRDCLHRLAFECNRFDFDFELVIKLVRKGYVPLEVPVNYASRSFADGKKVSAFRDPLTWIRALVKYRFVSIYRD
jgi:hypothetical protein